MRSLRLSATSRLRPDFVPTVEFEYKSATPAFNPEREVIWSDVYDDEAGLGLMVSAMKPIFGASDELLGVLGIDVTLARLTAAFEEAGPVGGGYWFLINTEGRDGDEVDELLLREFGQQVARPSLQARGLIPHRLPGEGHDE